MVSNNIPAQTVRMDPLSKLGLKYQTDKCPQIKHPFTPFYYEILKDKRKTIRKVLEIGIGHREMALKWRPYLTGASLLMWRDFFPNAEIFGIDILPYALYNDERIKSFICDQTNKDDLQRLIDNIGPDIDLIVDDGSHKTKDQIFTCLTLMPIINKNVIYIIEDAKEPETISRALNRSYDCWIPNLNGRFRDDRLVVVANKNKMNPYKAIKDLEAVRSVGRKQPYNWEPFMHKYNCDTICELGVCKGKNFHEMIKHKPQLAIAVDSWIEDGILSRNDGRYSQEELDKQYQDFADSVSGQPFVKIYRDYTFNAAVNFPDNYFDLTYIDADHTYEGCLRDITDWYPKVKKGRFLIGDDYRVSEYRIKFGVIEAVNEFAKNNAIEFFELPNYGWGLIKK